MDEDVLIKTLKSRKPRSVEDDQSEEIESFEDASSSKKANLKNTEVVKHVFKTREHGDNKEKQDIPETQIANKAGMVKETIALDVEEENAAGKSLK